MRALQLSGPAPDSRSSNIVEVAEPAPGPGEVAIEVAFAGVNFIDVMARRGDPGYATSWPYVPGLEVAGKIRALGDGVDGRQVGDRVAAFTSGGGFAEVATVPSALAVDVPVGLALETAAAAPLALSSAVLLLQDFARMRSGESVLMHAAGGGLGSAVAQVAAVLEAGLRIGLVGTENKIAPAVQGGWDHAVPAGESAADALRGLAPNGVDVILDTSGTANIDLDLQVAAPGARILLCGNPGGGAPAPLPQMGRLMGGNVGVLGFSISSLRRSRPELVVSALRRSLELAAAGRVVLDVTIVHGLAGVPEIHDLMAARRAVGKYAARLS